MAQEAKPQSFGRAVLVRVGIGVGAASLLVIVVGLLLPRTFSVERSRDVAAAPAVVYPHLEDLELWRTWAPWLQENPSVKVTPGPVAAGDGASLSWTGGSGESGGGRVELVHCEPPTRVDFTILFTGDRFPSQGSLLVQEDAAGSLVTWSMTGDMGWNPFNRYLGLLLGSFVGDMFDKGLDRLSMVAETADSTAIRP